MYCPRVLFQTPDGMNHAFVTPDGANPAKYKLGQTVKVKYDRAAGESHLLSFYERYLPSILLGVVGAFAGLLSIVSLFAAHSGTWFYGSATKPVFSNGGEVQNLR